MEQFFIKIKPVVYRSDSESLSPEVKINKLPSKNPNRDKKTTKSLNMNTIQEKSNMTDGQFKKYNEDTCSYEKKIEEKSLSDRHGKTSKKYKMILSKLKERRLIERNT